MPDAHSLCIILVQLSSMALHQKRNTSGASGHQRSRMLCYWRPPETASGPER
jgi:hypothetical protein